jgi:hypothetical protein
MGVLYLRLYLFLFCPLILLKLFSQCVEVTDINICTVTALLPPPENYQSVFLGKRLARLCTD